MFQASFNHSKASHQCYIIRITYACVKIDSFDYEVKIYSTNSRPCKTHPPMHVRGKLHAVCLVRTKFIHSTYFPAKFIESTSLQNSSSLLTSVHNYLAYLIPCKIHKLYVRPRKFTYHPVS